LYLNFEIRYRGKRREPFVAEIEGSPATPAPAFYSPATFAWPDAETFLPARRTNH
jgi:hypothetical protein